MRTRTRVSISSFVLAALATTSGAMAQTSCPTPTVVQCRDPAYLATACGQASVANEASACSVLIRTAYDAEMQRPDVSVEEVASPDDPETTVAAGVRPYSFFKHMTQHFEGQFLGVEQKSQLYNAGGGSINLFADGITRTGLESLGAQRERWRANGNVVQSCTEYVQERFHDYTRFRDLADVSLLSDEVLFDQAFDTSTGIANRTLYSKSGASALPAVVWPSNGQIGTIIVGGVPKPLMDPKAPKNGYFKAYKSLARGSFFGPADAAIRSKLQAGTSHHVVNWNWHAQMQDALSDEHPETLRYYEDQQQDFLKLTAERDKLLDLIAKHGPTFTSTDHCTGQPGCAPVTRDLQAELTALEAALKAQLYQADADGCIDAVNVTKCDWSYRQLRDQVAAFYSKHMEAAYQTCVANTSGNFASSSPVRNAVSAFGAPKNDYTTTAEDIEGFGAVVNNWVASQPFPKTPDGKPYIGDRKSDHGTLGSSDLSLDWSYDTGWEVTGLSPQAQACSANLSVDGAFTAVGHAYGTTVEVIDAAAKIYTEQSAGKAKVRLEVLDVKIWNRWDNPYSAELQTGLVKEMKSGTKKEFTTTVYPFGVPVTLGAGVGMSVGMKIDAKARIGGTCSSTPTGSGIDLATITGTVTPFAQADAFASAAVGVPGFRAGVKCNLVLVRGEMPISAGARITMSPSKAVTASLSFTGKQKFRMLDGNVKAFVDGPFSFLDSEWTLFSWQGPSIDEEIFKFEKSSMPLDLIKNYL
ncbi:hypothetical protein WME79_30580 [Sorangium sp. So ce726]|uniref:hypothetical protein n=1 Tax=Sorangium sp. So ce726 TaxID=3133319 RepID=UPI003F6072DA